MGLAPQLRVAVDPTKEKEYYAPKALYLLFLSSARRGPHGLHTLSAR